MLTTGYIFGSLRLRSLAYDFCKQYSSMAYFSLPCGQILPWFCCNWIRIFIHRLMQKYNCEANWNSLCHLLKFQSLCVNLLMLEHDVIRMSLFVLPTSYNGLCENGDRNICMKKTNDAKVHWSVFYDAFSHFPITNSLITNSYVHLHSAEDWRPN